VVGAIGLSCSPEVLIADEPTTSLDVTVQAAYLALLKDIRRQTELTILFITHDFGVVARMCDRVAVMYAGKIVETAPTWEPLDRPAHPYAEELLNSVPDLRIDTKRLYPIEGYPRRSTTSPQGASLRRVVPM
jgi:ABC-type dipeptide/oligopeptide/nickel transport system ATPase component